MKHKKLILKQSYTISIWLHYLYISVLKKRLLYLNWKYVARVIQQSFKWVSLMYEIIWVTLLVLTNYRNKLRTHCKIYAMSWRHHYFILNQNQLSHHLFYITEQLFTVHLIVHQVCILEFNYNNTMGMVFSYYAKFE